MGAAEIIVRPDELPLRVAKTLVEKWGEVAVIDVIEKYNASLEVIRGAVSSNLFNLFKAALKPEFTKAANDLLDHNFGAKKDPWNIPLHDNPKSLNDPEFLEEIGMTYEQLVDQLEEIKIINAHGHTSGTSLDNFIDIEALAANKEWFHSEDNDVVKIDRLMEIWNFVHFADDRTYNAFPFTFETMNEYCHKFGMLGGIVAVGQTVYRNNNDYIRDTYKQADGRAMGVASVSYDTPIEVIRELYADGVRGFRFTGVKRLDSSFDINKVMAFDKMLAESGLDGVNINLYLESAQLQEYKEQVLQMKTPVVLDHCAIPNVFNGADEASYQALAEILRNNPKNMIKGPGPERIMGANITAHLAAGGEATRAMRDAFLERADEFCLTGEIREALKSNEKLSSKICGELAVNPKIWDVYVLPIMQRLLKEFPDQFMFGTDAQHPNLVVPVDDGALMQFIFKATHIPDDPEGTKALRQKVMHDNAVKTYVGARFRRDENYIRNPDPQGKGGVYVLKTPKPVKTLDLRAEAA